jgi:transitional endoplasmic reticulum ATPase
VDVLSSVKLKVAEAMQQRDVGRSIARMDPETWKTLDLKEGDFVEIVGKKSTVAKAWSAYPDEVGQSLLRIDRFIRKNCQIPKNEFVQVKKAKVKPASYIKLAPVDIRILVDANFITFVKDRLIDYPVTNGDILYIMIQGHTIPFLAVDTKPDGFIKIHSGTEIEILNEPVQIPRVTVVRLVVVKNNETFKMFEGEQLFTTTTLCQLLDGVEVPFGLALWFTKNISVEAS